MKIFQKRPVFFCRKGGYIFSLPDAIIYVALTEITIPFTGICCICSDDEQILCSILNIVQRFHSFLPNTQQQLCSKNRRKSYYCFANQVPEREVCNFHNLYLTSSRVVYPVPLWLNRRVCTNTYDL